MTTPILGLDELTGNQDQPEVIVNENTRILEAMVRLVIKDRVAVLPGSPSDGDCYILTADTGGGTNGQIAVYSSGWHFVTPGSGWFAWVLDEGVTYQYGAGSPSVWAIYASSGAGISVANQGSPGDTLTNVTSLLFTGATVSDGGGGLALVAVESTAGGGGISDAPSDATYYARKDGAWVAIDPPGSAVTAITNTAGTVTMDLSAGDEFTHLMTANVTTLTLSNPPGAGKGYTKMLRITQDSTPRTFAWPASFKWAGGVAGAISTGSGAVDLLAITSFDNGTTNYVTLAKAFA